MNCYKITVKTTNSLNDTFFVPSDKELTEEDLDYFSKGEYFDCKDGEIYVIVSSPKIIFEKFGKNVVEKIEKVGIGYIL